MHPSRVFFVLLLPLWLIACQSPPADPAATANLGRLAMPLGETVIYELYPRSFSETGDFRGITPRLDELRELGITHIWLMPIHPIGETARKGTLGSPYSIADYRAINPEFGTISDFRDLVEAIHARGMFVMLDLVANHTAWDHAWVIEHPEWYVTDDAGRVTHPPGTDWTDVAQLDFSVPEVRDAMRGIMRFWVEEFGVDGYRADVAELVPQDFWEEAIAELRGIRPVLMLAEGHDPRLHDAGFDLTYSWTTYHAMKEVWRGVAADTLNALVSQEMGDFPLSGRLRFTTNHDETAWDDTPLVLFGGPDGARAAAVIAATMPGVPLIYNGQEVGDPQRLPLFERVPIDWEADTEMRSFYRDLLARRRASLALREGRHEALDHDRPMDVLAYRRVAAGDTASVVVNTRSVPVEVNMADGRRLHLGPYGWQID